MASDTTLTIRVEDGGRATPPAASPAGPTRRPEPATFGFAGDPPPPPRSPRGPAADGGPAPRNRPATTARPDTYEFADHYDLKPDPAPARKQPAAPKVRPAKPARLPSAGPARPRTPKPLTYVPTRRQAFALPKNAAPPTSAKVVPFKTGTKPPAGAGAGAAAGVAGAAAGAVAVAAVVAAGIEKATTVAQGAARAAGGIGVALAKNNNLEALTKAADVAADGLEKIPVVGGAAAESLKAVTTAATAFAQVTEAFANRGRELQGYDANIARGAAQADLIKMQSDMREAQRSGKQLGELIEKQAQLESVITELLAPIKEFVLDVLLKFIEAVLSYLANFSKTAKEIYEKMKEQKDLLASDPINDVLGAAERLLSPPLPADPVKRAAEARLGVPLFSPLGG